MTPEELLSLRHKRRADLKADEVKQLHEALSVREMFARKLESDIIKVTEKYDLGEFTASFKKLSAFDHDTRLAPSMAATADLTKSKEASEKLYELLGEISLDGLDAEFWRSGTGFSGDVLNSILLQIKLASTIPDKELIAKFRGK